MNRSTLRSACLLFGVLACLLLPAIALAQPVFKAIDGNSMEDHNHIELDTPSGTSVGDFMLVQISLSDDEAITSIPSGWTELFEHNHSRLRVWVGYKFVTQADIGATFSWDFDGYEDIVGQLRVYGNVDPNNPINEWSWDEGNDGKVNSPGIWTTLDNTLIIRMFGIENIFQPPALNPAQLHEFFEEACYCKEYGVIQGSGDLLQPQAGYSGTASWNNSWNDDNWISVTVALAEKPELATFQVTKDFRPDSSMPVEVFISCNDGLPLNNSQIITEDTGGVTFIVELFTPGNLDCEITEVPVPTGYDDSYVAASLGGTAGSIDEVDGCQFNDVEGGDFSCAIRNTAQDATYEVSKVWEIISEGGDLISQEFNLTITCNQEIVAASPGSNFRRGRPGGPPESEQIGKTRDTGAVTWLSLTGDTAVWVDVDSTQGPASCSARERVFTSVVEVDNPCRTPQGLTMGQTTSCTITNTVFYEGIPTLNRFGLAIMALLMLGVGFFRPIFRAN